jgi:hypothetical protein|tara:strand:+ start:5726 stop:6064 length:339 start_codon:yes stop_codon:yes gene_type:complete
MYSEEQLERKECDYKTFKSIDPNNIREHYILNVLSTAGHLQHFGSIGDYQNCIAIAIEIEKLNQNYELKDSSFNLDLGVHEYLDECTQILNKLEEIKKTVKILACDKADELL